MYRLFIVVVLIFLSEYYFYQALKHILSVKYHKYLWKIEILWAALLSLTFAALFFYRPHQWHDAFRVLLAIIILTEVSKLFGSVFMFLDDVRRLLIAGFHYLFRSSDANSAQTIALSRSQFFSQLGVLFTFIPLSGFIYGIVKGGYKFKIHQVKLFFPDLPKSFEGLKMVQISDLHLGSFFSTEPVKRIVDIVQKEQADIIFFTGDLVNNVFEEAPPFQEILSQLKAPLGVYSVLGNHDYGDYIQWNSAEEKQKNLQDLIQFQKNLSWDILLNEHRILEKNGEQIAIIGVENWGGNLHFPKYGRLDKAYKGAQSIPFKILLSHDPSHWDLQVSQGYKDIQLTLSGHTHGFQFGVEYRSVRFSPVQWVYKHWAGLYEKTHQRNERKLTQYLYVNRGVGFIGYPGRLGIWPEITVIELFCSS